MCEFYFPGSYNDCRETQAERVADKSAPNYCEYFKLKFPPQVQETSNNLKKLEDLFKK